ncbi:MAG TPA: CpsB/CapC family capsule biosynthesis tyrosine phosphatase [Gaiellaceae bacterium]|nr:CpsB/CapC family capsule biosynthesis tyrosine phosphatase [Gaiellaceae bacterium]
MIDLHSHVLFAIDDGPDDLEGSLEICRAAAADGIEVLAATPHVRRDHATTAEQMEARVDEVNDAVAGMIRIVRGGELDLAELSRPLEELQRFGLGGNPAYLLVETPYVGWPLDIGEKLFELRMLGVTPVLAHPERNAEVQERPELLEPLVSSGALVQLTATTVDGRSGPRSRACAKTLLERGWAHLIASDAHEATIREVGLSAARDAVGGELGRWLTDDLPRAIVEQRPLPPRPESKRRFGR